MIVHPKISFNKGVDTDKIDKAKLISALAEHICLLTIDDDADYKQFVIATLAMHIQLLHNIKTDKFKISIESIEVKH